jgi:hypothetical protein
VTARSARTGACAEISAGTPGRQLDCSTRHPIADPNWHRAGNGSRKVRMEAGRGKARIPTKEEAWDAVPGSAIPSNERVRIAATRQGFPPARCARPGRGPAATPENSEMREWQTVNIFA